MLASFIFTIAALWVVLEVIFAIFVLAVFISIVRLFWTVFKKNN